MQVIEPLTYIGSNRRADKTVIEWPLRLTSGEQDIFALAAANGLPALRNTLRELACEISAVPNDENAAHAVARWVVEIALAMQRAAGHRVAFSAVLPGSNTDQARLIYEYEHAEVGEEAGELAMRVLSEAVPGLQWEAATRVAAGTLEEAFVAFLARAGKLVLPLDTQAIIDAATRLDVPCVKLERAPYHGLEGDFRIRRNGLLKLGHSCYQHIVDGTLCVDRNPGLVPLLFDREQLLQCLHQLGLPTPRQDPEFRNVVSAKRALRSAERIGYPVVLKPARRSRRNEAAAYRGCSPLNSEHDVRLAFEQIRKSSPGVIVEQYMAGSTFHLLLANHEPVCVAVPDGSPMTPSALHSSILDMAVRASRTLDAGLLAITLVTPDAGRSLSEAGGAVVDIDPAPQLDRLLAGDAHLMARAAEGLVRCLYPPGTKSRIPLVAVTGTNGKTTTARMVARIMRTSGCSPGMASTSGIYFNEVLQQAGDLAGSGGHHILFESRDIDMGVLETARGGLSHSGFMFDWCDVAICLNVSADHLGEFGITTVHQMAELKRSVLERARHAVVLNADYTACREMLPFPAGVEVYLASVESGAGEVGDLTGQSSFICVLEQEEGQEWIILYDPGRGRLPVMPVAAIPATMDGAARCNISNAQHAICACHALGVGLDVIRQGLSTFDASFENNPGRLNIYRQLPFTVIMDYVHNPDGMEKLCALVDQMHVPGRKILLYAAYGNRTDEDVAQFARSALGHFDHYVCRSFPVLRGRDPGEVPALMKAALLDAGVAQEQITVVAEAEQGVFQALDLARPGDLIVLSHTGVETNTMWQAITSFQPAFAD